MELLTYAVTATLLQPRIAGLIERPPKSRWIADVFGWLRIVPLTEKAAAVVLNLRDEGYPIESIDMAFGTVTWSLTECSLTKIPRGSRRGDPERVTWTGYSLPREDVSEEERRYRPDRDRFYLWKGRRSTMSNRVEDPGAIDYDVFVDALLQQCGIAQLLLVQAA